MSEAGVLISYVDTIGEILKDVPAKFEANLRQIDHLEKETNDLIHALELLDVDEEQAAQYATDIRKNRLERRRCKDENVVLKPLYDFIKLHPKLAKEMKTCHEETKKACRLLKGRYYNPRVRTDLIEKFEKAKEAQEHG